MPSRTGRVAYLTAAAPLRAGDQTGNACGPCRNSWSYGAQVRRERAPAKSPDTQGHYISPTPDLEEAAAVEYRHQVREHTRSQRLTFHRGV